MNLLYRCLLKATRRRCYLVCQNNPQIVQTHTHTLTNTKSFILYSVKLWPIVGRSVYAMLPLSMKKEGGLESKEPTNQPMNANKLT